MGVTSAPAQSPAKPTPQDTARLTHARRPSAQSLSAVLPPCHAAKAHTQGGSYINIMCSYRFACAQPLATHMLRMPPHEGLSYRHIMFSSQPRRPPQLSHKAHTRRQSRVTPTLQKKRPAQGARMYVCCSLRSCSRPPAGRRLSPDYSFLKSKG